MSGGMRAGQRLASPFSFQKGTRAGKIDENSSGLRRGAPGDPFRRRRTMRRAIPAVAIPLVPMGVAMAMVGAPPQAQDRPIRIGVLNDLTSVYSDFQGKGSVLAAQMAVEDYG